MAETPEEAIAEAASAYVAGDAERLAEQLAEDVRVVGSEKTDDWDGRNRALGGLAGELGRRRRPNAPRVRGSLVEQEPIVDSTDEMAWSSRKGRLEIDGDVHEASWTTVLRRQDEGWKIVHSHFSIHR